MGMGRTRKKNKHLPQGVYVKHGAYWHARYVDGKKKWTRLGKTEAEALAAFSKLKEGVTAELSFAALCARYELEEIPRHAESSRGPDRSRLKALCKPFGAMAPADIEPPDVWDYWQKRGEGSAARHEVKLLSSVLNYGIKIGACKENPCRKVRIPTQAPRDRYVTDAEFLAVRALAPPMVGYAMDLALICGMDRGTVVRLERRHLTKDGIAFTRGKTGREQLIRWNPDLREVTDAMEREPPRLRAALICQRTGQPFTPAAFSAAWHRLMVRAEATGIARFHFHDLRAKSASDADSDQTAADRLGHGDVKLTRKVYRRLPRVADAGVLPSRIVDRRGK